MGAQYLDTGWFGVLMTLVIIGFILFNIIRASGGRDLYIRRIPGLNAIDEAVGRAAEMGRPVVMVPGLPDGLSAQAMQALNIFTYVTRTAIKFANPILMCCYNAAVYTVAQEMIRDVYQSEGAADRYDADSVRFISDRQFAFAAGVSGLLLREQAAAAFFLGEFYAESLIFAETANGVGAIQVASSTEVTQTPFFIAACDYVLIGDEFYAAGAYLNRQPILTGSLVGQDWAKMLILFFIMIGTLLTTIERPGKTTWEYGKGAWTEVPERWKSQSDTSFYRLFNPSPPEFTVERPLKPEETPAAPTEGGATN